MAKKRRIRIGMVLKNMRMTLLKTMKQRERTKTTERMAMWTWKTKTGDEGDKDGRFRVHSVEAS